MMTVTVKLSQSDFLKANLAVLSKRPLFLLIMCCMLFIVGSNSVMAIGRGKSALPELLPALIVVIIFGSLMYFGIRRSYTGNKRAGETIAYSFADENLVIQGESFRSELSWDKVYKVSTSKNWLLVWQNRQIANAIPKASIPEGGLTVIKNVLDKNGVKNNL